jgi:hypothetical protein
MDDGIEKVNPVNTMDIRISGENKIKYKKVIKGKKTNDFKDVFKSNARATNQKEEKKINAKYKNGRRIR